jgi:aminomuconate-semialdehyde/2-hydroxymuconate-6-semialdehyde dehydrogenase
MTRLTNWIGGEALPPQSGRHLDRENPATGLLQLQIPDSGAEDVELGVRAAQKAFIGWSRRPPSERADLCDAIADRIEENAAELAEIESRDQGKPVWLAKTVDIPRAVHNFRFFAGAVRHQVDESARMDEGTLNIVSRQPVGVAGLISPWNLPLYLLSWKIAPCIAFGNTAVCKPSEFTSWSAFRIGQLINDAGVPPGVVNMVFGTGASAGAPLVRHPRVRLVSFTGGTQTGQAIARDAAPMMKKLSLELGGKNSTIVFADADLKLAVETSVRAGFLNQGEICLCGSRLLLHESIADEFLRQYIKRVKELVVGDPLQKESFMGPLVSKAHLEKVESFIQLAKEEGSEILTGGSRVRFSDSSPTNGGWFFEPTVIRSKDPKNSRLENEEIFGPVVTVTTFRRDDEAVELANQTMYGLSASVWTRDLNRAFVVSGALEVGTVWVNTWMKRDLRMPFGGQKMSGVGREGQRDSLEFFTEAKTICLNHGRG